MLYAYKQNKLLSTNHKQSYLANYHFYVDQKPPLLRSLPCKYNLALRVLINWFFNSHTFLKGKVSVLSQSSKLLVTLSQDWRHWIAFPYEVLLKNCISES